MADVVGYSRLMAADEEGAIAQLKTSRKELIIPKEKEYHGRTVKLMGDGALMEFGSVVDAVNFAIDVQRATKRRNEDVPQDQQTSYRIGINIDDIIVDGQDIYGDGVNIAARLEPICEPDSIYLTENVFLQAENKVDVAFEVLGKKNLKNIPVPISVYRVLLDSVRAGNSAIDNRKASSGILRAAPAKESSYPDPTLDCATICRPHPTLWQNLWPSYPGRFAARARLFRAYL